MPSLPVKKILMIDDNEYDRALISRVLRGDKAIDWQIEECANGQEGVRCLGQSKFDCVLLDYVLPDEDGLGILKKLRRMNFETPVIMMTGNGCEAVAIDAFKNGAQDYVVKTGVESRNLTDIIFQAVERKENELDLIRRANFDSLTGLANRNVLPERIEQAIARADRNRTAFALIYMDLNGFKHINDTYGHDAGDAILKEVSVRLSQSVRCGDTVVRIGGDEFVALVECLAENGIKSCTTAANRMYKEISDRPILFNGQMMHVAASLGIAIYPLMASHMDELIKMADSAMYEAKKDPAGGYKFAVDLH